MVEVSSISALEDCWIRGCRRRAQRAAPGRHAGSSPTRRVAHQIAGQADQQRDHGRTVNAARLLALDAPAAAPRRRAPRPSRRISTRRKAMALNVGDRRRTGAGPAGSARRPGGRARTVGIEQASAGSRRRRGTRPRRCGPAAAMMTVSPPPPAWRRPGRLARRRSLLLDRLHADRRRGCQRRLADRTPRCHPEHADQDGGTASGHSSTIAAADRSVSLLVASQAPCSAPSDRGPMTRAIFVCGRASLHRRADSFRRFRAAPCQILPERSPGRLAIRHQISRTRWSHPDRPRCSSRRPQQRRRADGSRSADAQPSRNRTAGPGPGTGTSSALPGRASICSLRQRALAGGALRAGRAAPARRR